MVIETTINTLIRKFTNEGYDDEEDRLLKLKKSWKQKLELK